MPTTAPIRRAALLGAALTLTTAAAAQAAHAPATLTKTDVRHAGQTAPYDVPGNHLHAGQTIREGYELIRYRVQVHGLPSANFSKARTVTISAPKGSIVTGLGLSDRDPVEFAVHSDYDKPTLEVSFRPFDGKTVNARGALYVLVRKA